MGSMATRSVCHSKNKVRGQKHPRKVVKNRNSIPNIIQHTKSKDRQHPAQDNHYPRRAGHHRPFHMSHLHINLFMGLRFWWRVIAFLLQLRHNDHDGVSNHQPHGCLLNRLFKRRSKKTSKLRVTGLCVGNSPVTGEFPAQRPSNAEDVSIWWRHHIMLISHVLNGTKSPIQICHNQYRLETEATNESRGDVFSFFFCFHFAQYGILNHGAP